MFLGTPPKIFFADYGLYANRLTALTGIPFFEKGGNEIRSSIFLAGSQAESAQGNAPLYK